MAIIRPFKGVRYNQAVVGDLSKVVAPPYDVISPEEQVRYHEQHPNNVVRLILPMEDSTLESKYTHAASCLRDWLGEKVLIQDEEPCLYAYEQEFAVRGEYKKRLGFTCIVKLEDYESGTVLPHENTLAKPREDRLKIMRATRANLDSVFGLFQNGSIDAVLRQFTALNPDAVATDKDGVKSRLWRISDQDAIDFITLAMPLVWKKSGGRQGTVY